MYEIFYGFREKPFDLAPNPSFLYRSKKHQDAIAYLEYGLLKGSGLILLTGDSGAGKTTIVRHLLNNIEENIEVGTIFNTHADSEEFLDRILHEFALEPTDNNKTKSLETIFRYLVTRYSQGKRVLLVIDDAHNLPGETLEEIRMLSDLQTDNHRLLQIILVGQPELKRRLQSGTLAQLSQRTAVYYHLGALDRDEISEYIAYRLGKADGSQDIFETNAFDLIYQASGGIPKIINLLCDTALTNGYAKSLDRINLDVVARIIRTKEKRDLPKNTQSEDNQSPQIQEVAQMVPPQQQQGDWPLTEPANHEPNANDRLVAELAESLRKEREKTDKLLLEYGRLKAGLTEHANSAHIRSGSQAKTTGQTKVHASPLLSQITLNDKDITEEKVQRVFVKEDNCAKIHCESCGRVRELHLQDFASLAPVVRIRCACSAVFPVRFEYRKFYRKTTNLEGTYHVLFEEQNLLDLSLDKKTINCRVENISMYGSGFSTLSRHRIEKNARLILGFLLDNPRRTWIEKTGVVQLVDGSYIGLKFDESASTPRELGFYLRP